MKFKSSLTLLLVLLLSFSAASLLHVAVKGSAHHEAVKIKYDGVVYGSITEARAATNKSYYLLTKYGERL